MQFSVIHKHIVLIRGLSAVETPLTLETLHIMILICDHLLKYSFITCMFNCKYTATDILGVALLFSITCISTYLYINVIKVGHYAASGKQIWFMANHKIYKNPQGKFIDLLKERVYRLIVISEENRKTKAKIKTKQRFWLETYTCI